MDLQLDNKVKKAKKAIKERFWLRQVVIAVSGLFVLIMLSVIFLSIYTKHGRQYELPNLVGLTLDEAKIESKGLRLRFDVFDSIYVPQQPKGAILEQYPKPGSIIKKHRRVVITINSYKPKKVEVPYVAGLSLRSAKNKLVSAGLEIGKLTYVSDIATNNVLEQYYEGRPVDRGGSTIAYMGSKVDLTVGLNEGEAYPLIPTLLGMSYHDAREMLWERGYNLGDVKMTSDVDYSNMMEATVVDQTIYPLTAAPYGSRVGLKISTDDREIAKSRKMGKRRQQSVETLTAKLKLHRDTIEWIRKGRTVRTKHHNDIYEYSPLDTFAIYDRIMILTRELEEITGTQSNDTDPL